MNTTQEAPANTNKAGEARPHHKEIDRNAPAGSENSLGEESIRDGRPNTDDTVVEAIDELDPAIPG